MLYGQPFAANHGRLARHVAIVNRTLARRIEPSADVIGRSVRLGTAASDRPYEIIGVVEDTRWWGTTVAPLNEVYVPFEQRGASSGYVIVHSQLDTGAVTKSIRTAFNDVLPGAALPPSRSAITLNEMIRRSFAAPRFNTTLIASFSVIALILAVVGLFGLVAYSVSQRRRELALRMALGASAMGLLITSMRTAMVLTGIGVVAGLSTAVYLTRFIEGQLYGVDPPHVPTFVAASILMIATAGIGAYFPARRAAHADAMTALRCE
jgi:ABC-type antimicrobial peptide transport system permease subunit